MSPQDINEYLPFIIPLIVLLMMMRRLKKPRRVRPNFLWVAPVLITIGAGFFAMGAYFKGGPLTMVTALALLAGLLLGVAAGWYRARSLHLHRDPDTGFIMMRLSIEGLIFLIVLMAARTAMRQMSGGAANPFSVVAEACMAFVVGLLFARSYVMWKRCKALPSSGAAAPEFQS
ncbi:MAG: hypothetical protein JWM77_617 [Rhodospirillales bacterium]|jgi:hypothetical protein|nr:hypothetical protein [Rhodospirillales bacterium]